MFNLFKRKKHKVKVYTIFTDYTGFVVEGRQVGLAGAANNLFSAVSHEKGERLVVRFTTEYPTDQYRALFTLNRMQYGDLIYNMHPHAGTREEMPTSPITLCETETASVFKGCIPYRIYIL